VKTDLLVTGAGGQLGSVLMRRLATAGRAAVGTISPGGTRPMVGSVRACDLRDFDATAVAVREMRPSCIVHAAAMTSVAKCFEKSDEARLMNVDATRHLVELAEECGARFVLTSTDLVFDGTTGDYDESSVERPTSVYGRSKLAAENIVLSYSRGAAARLALMYGLPAARRRTTFMEQMGTLRRGGQLRLFHDEFRSALELEDASAALEQIAESEFVGVVHVAGPEALSRLEMGQIAAAALGVRGEGIESVSQADVPAAEARPADVSMACGRFEALFGRAPGRPMAEAMVGVALSYLSDPSWNDIPL